MNRNLSPTASDSLLSLSSARLAPASDYAIKTEEKLVSWYKEVLHNTSAPTALPRDSANTKAAYSILAHYASEHISEHLGTVAAKRIDCLGFYGQAVVDETNSPVSFHILLRAQDKDGRYYVLTESGVSPTESKNVPSFTKLSLKAGMNRENGGLTFTPIISDEELYEAKCSFRALMQTHPEDALLSDNLIAGALFQHEKVEKILNERKYGDQLTITEVKSAPPTYTIRCGNQKVIAMLAHEKGHLIASARELKPTRKKSTPREAPSSKNSTFKSSPHDQILHLYLSTIGTGAHFSELTESERENMKALEQHFMFRSEDFGRESGVFPDKNLQFTFEKPDVLIDGMITTGLCTLGTIVDSDGNHYVTSSVGLHKVSGVAKTGVFKSQKHGYSFHPYLSADAYENELNLFLDSVNEGAYAVINRQSIIYGMIFDSIRNKLPVHPEDLAVISQIDISPPHCDACLRLDFNTHMVRVTLRRDPKDNLTPRIKATPYK